MSAPDRASNSSVESPELVTQVGRKRLRSPSMQSDSGASSSSMKRSVADSSTNEIQIRSPRPDQPFSITSTDPNQDIDAYMAEQGEAEIPAFTPSSLSQSDASSRPISRAEKLSRVQVTKRTADGDWREVVPRVKSLVQAIRKSVHGRDRQRGTCYRAGSWSSQQFLIARLVWKSIAFSRGRCGRRICATRNLGSTC